MNIEKGQAPHPPLATNRGKVGGPREEIFPEREKKNPI